MSPAYSPPEDVEHVLASLRALKAEGKVAEQNERVRALIDKALLVERVEARPGAIPSQEDVDAAALAALANVLLAGAAAQTRLVEQCGAAWAEHFQHALEPDFVVVRLAELESLARSRLETKDMTTLRVATEVLLAASVLWKERAKKLLATVAVRRQPCKGCGVQLQMVPTALKRWAPYTEEVINHFVDCPDAKRFRAKGGGT